MTFLVWRQHRNQAAIAAAALAALLCLVVVTGLRLADAFHSAKTTCATFGTCGGLPDVFTGYDAVTVLLDLTLVVPGLLGLFWGAPLLARELESGTHRFVWTQTVTRRRWLAVKLGWLLPSAVVVGAAIGSMVSWWSGPANSYFHYRFDRGHFDVQGIVPIGYCVFAVALGVLAGAVLRRVLPALAVTLVGFGAVRFAIAYLARPHYLKALTTSVPFGTKGGPSDGPSAGPGGDLPGSAWTLSRTFLDPSGHASHDIKLSPDTIPGACRGLFPKPGGDDPLAVCLGRNGWRSLTTYQPAGRFWTFQLVETAIYLGLAAALVAATFWVVHRLDA